MPQLPSLIGKFVLNARCVELLDGNLFVDPISPDDFCNTHRHDRSMPLVTHHKLPIS